MATVDALPGRELENAEDNACFACGPANPAGLRMRFFDDGSVVRSRLTLDDRHCGDRGHVLHGILYAAMDDALWWAAWARWDELPMDAEPGGGISVSYPTAVRTGEPFVVEARSLGPGPDVATFEAVCIQRGDVCARMTWAIRRRTKAEIEKALADPKLASSLRPIYEKALARRS